jgi:hypothetical protein
MPALVAGIHVLQLLSIKDVDGRDEPVHDGGVDYAPLIRPTRSSEKLAPFQGDADVARHTLRKIDDLVSYPVATRLEIFLKKLKELFR